jgi:hypothetical protein
MAPEAALRLQPRDAGDGLVSDSLTLAVQSQKVPMVSEDDAGTTRSVATIRMVSDVAIRAAILATLPGAIGGAGASGGRSR